MASHTGSNKEIPCLKVNVDSDGHVMEDAEDLIKFVRPPFDNRGSRNWLPSLDHFHTPADGTPRTPGTFDPKTGPEQWLEFLDKTETDYTVLYPRLD